MAPSLLLAQLLALFAAVALVQRLLEGHKPWLRSSARAEPPAGAGLSAEQPDGIGALGMRMLAAVNDTAGGAARAEVHPAANSIDGEAGRAKVHPAVNNTSGTAGHAEVYPAANDTAGEAGRAEGPTRLNLTWASTVLCATGCGSKLGVKCPLVVALHGAGDNDASIMKRLLFGWNNALLFADASYCIVFPMSTSGQDWNLNHDSPDFQLVVNVANQAISAYNIDTSAVYLLGYSNGGCLGYALMCGYMAYPFVAFASVESQPLYTYVGFSKYCCPNPKFHLMAVQGTADTAYPINRVYSAAFCATQPQVVQKHGKEDNRCSGPSSGNAVFMANTVITAYEDDCSPGGSASLYTVIGGTHNALTNTLWKEVWHYYTAIVPSDLQ